LAAPNGLLLAALAAPEGGGALDFEFSAAEVEPRGTSFSFGRSDAIVGAVVPVMLSHPETSKVANDLRLAKTAPSPDSEVHCAEGRRQWK